MSAAGHAVSLSHRSERLHIGVWLLLVILMLFLLVRDYDSHPAIGIDSSRYVVLAQSLVAGESFGLISHPGTPTPAQFPFGYPLILAPLVALVPGNFDLLRLPSMLATVVSAALLFWGWPLLSRRSYRWALAVTALFCLSPVTILYGRLVLSEAVFTALLLGAILLAEWGVRRRPPWWWTLVFGFVLTLMVFTRTVGWAMLVGILLYMVWRRRRQALVLVAGTGIVMAACTALVVWLTPVGIPDLFPRTYLDQYAGQSAGRQDAGRQDAGRQDAGRQDAGQQDAGSATGVFARFVRQMAWQRAVQDAPSTILPGIRSTLVLGYADRLGLRSLTDLIALATTGLLVLGAIRWLHREGLSAFLAAALPYAVVLAAWNWNGPRLLYPIQSQIAYAFLIGVEGVLVGLGWMAFRHRPAQWRLAMLGALAAAMIAGYGLISLLYPSHRAPAAAAEERAVWLRDNTPPDAVIMSNTPETDFLYTGRKALYHPAAADVGSGAAWREVLEREGVDVVITVSQASRWSTEEGAAERQFISSEGEDALSRAIQGLAAEGVLDLVYTGAGDVFRIYAVTGATARANALQSP